MKPIKLFASVFITVACATTFAQDGTFTSRSLTTETAVLSLRAAEVGLALLVYLALLEAKQMTHVPKRELQQYVTALISRIR